MPTKRKFIPKKCLGVYFFCGFSSQMVFRVKWPMTIKWKIESGLDHFRMNYILSCLLCECGCFFFGCVEEKLPDSLYETKINRWNLPKRKFDRARKYKYFTFSLKSNTFRFKYFGHVLDGLTYIEEATHFFLFIEKATWIKPKSKLLSEKKDRNWLMIVSSKKFFDFVIFNLTARKANAKSAKILGK